MSKFLDDFNAALEKIAAGGGSDPETKAAVASLQTSMSEAINRIAENDSDDTATKTDVAEVKEAVLALAKKLADSTPPEE